MYDVLLNPNSLWQQSQTIDYQLTDQDPARIRTQDLLGFKFQMDPG